MSLLLTPQGFHSIKRQSVSTQSTGRRSALFYADFFADFVTFPVSNSASPDSDSPILAKALMDLFVEPPVNPNNHIHKRRRNKLRKKRTVPYLHNDRAWDLQKFHIEGGELLSKNVALRTAKKNRFKPRLLLRWFLCDVDGFVSYDMESDNRRKVSRGACASASPIINSTPSQA